MSVGMNLLFEIVGQVAKKLGDEYDIEIVETHHRLKKDSPSGSAMTLAEKIAAATNKKFPDCLDIGRKGKEVAEEKRLNRHAGNPIRRYGWRTFSYVRHFRRDCNHFAQRSQQRYIRLRRYQGSIMARRQKTGQIFNG